MVVSTSEANALIHALNTKTAVVVLAEKETEVQSYLPRTLAFAGFENVCTVDTPENLLRTLATDPLLAEYDCALLPEVDNATRSLDTDLVLSLMKKAVSARAQHSNASLAFIVCTSLRSVVPKLIRLLHDAPVVELSYAQPKAVNVRYLSEPVKSYIDCCIDTAFAVHIDARARGDILIFLPSKAEVDAAMQRARARSESASLLLMKLHADLPEWQVREACSVHQKRKLVLATAVAESSVTVEGITHVVDSLYRKRYLFDANARVYVQCTEMIDKATAAQRASRAGKGQIGTAAGLCYRLCTESSYKELPEQPRPNVQALDLTHAILKLKGMGVDNLLNIDWLDQPPAKHVSLALENLHALGAIDDDGKLTAQTGQIMAELPVDPLAAKALIQAGSLGCSQELMAALACAQAGPIFACNRASSVHKQQSRRARRESEQHALAQFAVREGDHLTYVNAIRAFVNSGRSRTFCEEEGLSFEALEHALSIRANLQQQLRKLGVPISLSSSMNTSSLLTKAIASGYFMNTARLSGADEHSNLYTIINSNTNVRISKLSSLTSLSPSLVLFGTAEQCEGEDDKPKLIHVTEVTEEVLRDVANHYFSDRPV